MLKGQVQSHVWSPPDLRPLGFFGVQTPICPPASAARVARGQPVHHRGSGCQGAENQPHHGAVVGAGGGPTCFTPG